MLFWCNQILYQEILKIGWSIFAYWNWSFNYFFFLMLSWKFQNWLNFAILIEYRFLSIHCLYLLLNSGCPCYILFRTVRVLQATLIWKGLNCLLQWVEVSILYNQFIWNVILIRPISTHWFFLKVVSLKINKLLKETGSNFKISSSWIQELQGLK